MPPQTVVALASVQPNYARTTGPAWIQIDLGKKQSIKSIWTQFEYGTQFYQYLIETSNDGKHWQIFFDKRQNRLAGSPMVDFGNSKAQYIRLTYTGGQKNGFGGAIWNLKVYGTVEDSAPQQWLGLTAADYDGTSWHNNEGMLGGEFSLIQGTILRERIDCKDALTMQPEATLVMKHPQLGKNRKHTLTAMAFDNGSWYQIDENDPRLKLSEGKLEIIAGEKPVILTNLRYYNWEQETAEKIFDAKSDIVRETVADKNCHGLVVDINADFYNEGDTVPYIKNGSPLNVHLKGELETLGDTAAIIKSIDGKKAFCFTGKEAYRSNFMLSATIRDNAPYTIEAWILNPEISVNECVADFTSSHNELEKLMLVNGTEPRCGIMNHYGWYEDAGYKDMKNLTGKWQHIYICFDGRIESVYINDKLISQKDIQLLVKPSQFMLIGKNAENAWPFTGYLHSLKLWDEYIPAK